MVRRAKDSKVTTGSRFTNRRLGFIAGAGVASLTLLFLLTNDPRGASPVRAPAPSAARRILPGPAKAAARPLASYASLMRRDLFKPLVVGSARRLAGSAAAGTPGGSPAPLPLPLPSVRAAGTSPAGQWSYVGTVSVDGVKLALAQNGPNGDSGYFRVGESLDGFLIRAIRPDALVLTGPDGATISLPKTSGAPAPAAAPSGRFDRGGAPPQGTGAGRGAAASSSATGAGNRSSQASFDPGGSSDARSPAAYPGGPDDGAGDPGFSPAFGSGGGPGGPGGPGFGPGGPGPDVQQG